MPIRIVSTHPNHTHARARTRTHWIVRVTRVHFADLPTFGRLIQTPSLCLLWWRDLAVFVHVWVCVPQCVPVADPLIPDHPADYGWGNRHAGDKIDVYSPPKQLWNMNTEGAGTTAICWYHSLQRHASMHLPSHKWRPCGVRGWLMVSIKITLGKSDAAADVWAETGAKTQLRVSVVPGYCLVYSASCKLGPLQFFCPDPLCHPVLVRVLPKSITAVPNLSARTARAVQGLVVTPVKRWIALTPTSEVRKCDAAGCEGCVGINYRGCHVFRFCRRMFLRWKQI